jgi:large subunit ribosomal protein L10
MPRPEKVQAVADIKERLANAQAVFLAEYAGLSVTEQQQLRRALRATEGQFKVVKMTLARLAADELGHSDLAELLTGPTGLTFADRDAAATAKALRDFANDHANLTIKGALLSGDVISADQVSELADLPSREVLLSQIAGAFEAPMAKLASLLGAMPRDLATMVQQLIEKMGGDAPDDEPEPVAEAPAEAPAEEAPAEAPAEEAPAEAPAEEAAVEEAPAESAEAPAEDAPAEKAAAEEAPAEEAPAEAPAEEAAAESAEAPAEETDAGEKPGAADETNDENDQADEAEEE